MMHLWTIIGVRHVATSIAWYQSLLGLPSAAPAHDYFGQIIDAHGTVLLCLHEWGHHEHPSLMRPSVGDGGNGLLLFFRVEDFDAALLRVHSAAMQLMEQPHVNSITNTREFSLRDPDGYVVTLSALPG